MRTDVKIGLVALFVLVLCVAAYFTFIRPPRTATKENITPLPQPGLTTSAKPGGGAALAGTHGSGGDHGHGSGSIAVVRPLPTAIAGKTTPASANGGGKSASGTSSAPGAYPLAIGGTGHHGHRRTGSEGSVPVNSNTYPGTGGRSGQSSGVADNGGSNSSNAGGSGAQGGDTGVPSIPHLHSGNATGGSSGGATTGTAAYKTYVVRPHDTLVRIERRFYHAANRRIESEIVNANAGLHPNTIFVGQKLRLPRPSGEEAASTANGGGGGSGGSGGGASSSGASGASTRGKWYTVRRHDTLRLIARRVYRRGSAWKTIYKANRARIGGNPGDIRVGQRLFLPGR